MAGARAGTSTPIGEGADVTELTVEQEGELTEQIKNDLRIGEDAGADDAAGGDTDGGGTDGGGDDFIVKEKVDKPPKVEPKKDAPPPKKDPPAPADKANELPEPPDTLLDGKPKEEPAKKIYDGIDQATFVKTYGPKAGKVFEALKNDLAAAVTENAELKKKPAGEAPADYAELQEKYKKSQERLSQLSLADSETFQQEYDVPIGAAFEEVKSYIKELGLPEAIATQALQKPIKDRLAFLESVVKTQDGKTMVTAAASISNKLDEVGKLVKRRLGALQNWQVTAAEQKKKQAAGGQLLAGQQRKQLLEKALVDERKDNNFMLSEVAGQEDWNRAVAVHTATAQRIIESSDAQLQVRHILKGVAFDALAALYRRRNDRLRALEAEINDYKATHGELGARGTHRQPSRPGKTDAKKEMTGLEAVEAMENNIE